VFIASPSSLRSVVFIQGYPTDLFSMSENLDPLPSEPRPGRYRHYKGNLYEVIGLARHSETLEPMVIYRAKYGDESIFWVRPQPMWGELVDAAGRKVLRFSRMED
jgi:hypothetical protein